MTFEATWFGGPNDGSTLVLPDGTTRYQMTVQIPVMLNGQPLPGEYVAEQVSYPVVVTEDGQHRIVWHA